MRESTTSSNLPNLVNPSLNDQPPPSCRNKPLKYLLEILRNLLEGTLNRFVLALVEHLHQLIDRFCRFLKLFTTLPELVALFREVVVLFESLLVDVGEFLETLVDVM